MRVIVCVDDNGGMLFNHRRQSRDRVLCERVLQMADERDCSVYMNMYSAKIFPEVNRIAEYENYQVEIDISKMTKVQEEEFVGFSHEKITMVVYER